MRRKKPCFLVLESYWSEDLRERESVQPFVKGLCDLQAWEFHYRTIDSANDLKLWIKNFNVARRSRSDKIVYLATGPINDVVAVATGDLTAPTQLLVNQGLKGTVVSNFVISEQGAVIKSKATGVNADVSGCVAGVISTIQFPKPKGAGIVNVRYPFNFSPTGG